MIKTLAAIIGAFILGAIVGSVLVRHAVQIDDLQKRVTTLEKATR